jgi:hypothetical protein
MDTPTSGTSSDAAVTVSVLVEADTDDYFEANVYHNNGSDRNVSGTAGVTYFDGHAVASQIVPAATTVQKYSTAWATSHGGVTVANGATLPITHNLGTKDVVSQIYVADNASGTGAIQIGYALDGNYSTGANINNMTSTTTNVYLGHQGWIETPCDAGSNCSKTFASKYIKVVVMG